MARFCLCLLAALFLGACASPLAHHPSSHSPSPVARALDTSDNHRCADLFASALASEAPVPGSWDCLSPAVQRTFHGTGDSALAMASANFLDSHLVGCEADTCTYSMQLEATTSARSGVDAWILVVWLGPDARVAHYSLARPLP